MKKPLSSIIAVLLAIAMLAGCGGQQNEAPAAAAPGSPEAAAVVEITMAVYDRGVPAEAGTADDNATIRFMNEQIEHLGVRLVYRSAPRNDYRTILNTWIAAGDQPDLMYEYSWPWLNQLRLQGVLLELGDYIDTYSNEYKAYLQGNTMDMLRPFIEFEGKDIYALTTLRDIQALPVAAIWYRSDLFEAAGITKEPETVDELLEAARALKAYDDYIIPFGTSTHYHNMFWSIYGLSAGDTEDANGDLVPHWRSPNWRDAVETMRTIYQEGLVDPEYFTDTTLATRNANLVNGRIAMNIDGWSTVHGQEELKQNVPTSNWEPIPTVSSPYGKFMPTPQFIPFLYLLFEARMSDAKIEAAFKWVDWLLREKVNPHPHVNGPKHNFEDIEWGLEGIHWEIGESGFRRNLLNPNPIWVNGGEYATIKNPRLMQKGELVARAANDYWLEHGVKQEKMLKGLTSLPVANLMVVDWDNERLSDLNQNFALIHSDVLTQVITDPNYSIDQALADLEVQWRALAGDAIYREKNDWYQANKASFNNTVQAWIRWMNGLAVNLN